MSSLAIRVSKLKVQNGNQQKDRPDGKCISTIGAIAHLPFG